MDFNSDEDVPSVEELRRQAAPSSRLAKPTVLDRMTDQALNGYRADNKKANRLLEAQVEHAGLSKRFLKYVQLWVSRYEGVMAKAYSGRPMPRPDGEKITLVLRAMAHELRGRRLDPTTLEPAKVHLHTLKAGFIALAWSFRRDPRWRPWSTDTQLNDQVRSLFGSLVREGVVVARKERALLTSVNVRSGVVLARRVLARAITDGVSSWDVTVNQLATFAILLHTGFRAGDLGYVKGEDDASHALNIRDVSITVAQGQPATFENIEMVLSCTYVKGNR